MKLYGKINDYNGVYGNIIGNDGLKYTLLDKNIIDDNDLHTNDNVEFEGEHFEAPEAQMNIAYFVKKKEL